MRINRTANPDTNRTTKSILSGDPAVDRAFCNLAAVLREIALSAEKHEASEDSLTTKLEKQIEVSSDAT
ncbi:MAG: hypothetical protein GY845_24650 [Planctomycetes bacterium]|nr:hypothetical protein [Planctomycetota bacterium]